MAGEEKMNELCNVCNKLKSNTSNGLCNPCNDEGDEWLRAMDKSIQKLEKICLLFRSKYDC